ncbi:MAG: diguanylate cyclase [Actinomycetota bacterium]|nr:diguanylate cyclase [Actinomycetota bacterium]
MLLFSVSTSLILGVTLGLAWLYFQTAAMTKEISRGNRTRQTAIQRILADEFRGPNKTVSTAAKHVGRAFFYGKYGKDIVKGEITNPDGIVLASRDKRAVGRPSTDAGEIRESIRLKRLVTSYWVLRRPGDLTGKQKISGPSPFTLNPKVQEFTMPVFVKGRTELALHIYISLNRSSSSVRSLAFIAALIILNITLASAVLTFFWLDRLIYKPILALDEAAERITVGDTSVRAVVTNEDEFGELARRFNAMADSLIDARFQADTDSLTGLFNYRHLHSFLAAQLALAQRYERELTVAMLDIDHFKNVNDLYGHPTGDDVLRMAVGFIKSQLRQVDYMARYGGEEFVIIMPETGLEEGIKVMERVLVGFPDNVYVERMGIKHPVFISIGVADFPYCGEDANDILTAADMALLLSKRRGRNQVSYFRSINQKNAG